MLIGIIVLYFSHPSLASPQDVIIYKKDFCLLSIQRLDHQYHHISQRGAAAGMVSYIGGTLAEPIPDERGTPEHSQIETHRIKKRCFTNILQHYGHRDSLQEKREDLMWRPRFSFDIAII